MKVRNNFVTNSSSSSFILAFKDESDYEEFEEYCREYLYDEVFELIEKLKKKSHMTKDDVVEQLHKYYSREVENKAYTNIIPDYESLSNKELKKARQEAADTERYKKELEHLIITETKFNKSIDMIKDRNLFINGTIWDSFGGILEYSIRNDILKREFPEWCILNYNVG